MNFKLIFLLLVIAMTSFACKKSKIEVDSTPVTQTPSVPTPPVTPPVDPDLFVATVLSSPAYTNISGARTYDLLKVQSGSKAPTYMQWIANDTNTTAGAVIIYYPYEGIDWSGDPIDAKWALRGNGPHNDDDAAYYNAGTSSQVTYTAMSHATAADSQGLLTFNGLHVLVVYGRFYAGTTIADNTKDIVDAYRFLNSQTLVDKTKIGIYSGSWGGVGVLFGTKAAEAYSIKPKAISLAYPVSDAKALPQYIDSIATIIPGNPTVQGYYNAFFEPYKRRIDKATEALAGQPTRYDAYSVSRLASLDASMYVIHDDWDTLVPLSFTTNLYNTVASSKKIGFFQKQNGPINYNTFGIDHSQSSSPLSFATTLTWNYLFLIDELTDPAVNRLSGYSLVETATKFLHMKSMYDLGINTQAFRESLALMCKPNLYLRNFDDNGIYAASDIFALIMDYAYQPGWAPDGPSACAKLITNPPY